MDRERARARTRVLLAVVVAALAIFFATARRADAPNDASRATRARDVDAPAMAPGAESRADADARDARATTRTSDRASRRKLRPSLASTSEAVTYCVVGAGPGGTQTATYIRREIPTARVVVFERSARAGSFFERFPVHRRLISVNKRYFTGAQTDDDFRLRHDWNSLVDPVDEGGERLLMGNYSREYYPHASDLARYVDDFATAKLEGLVSYETEVSSVERGRDGAFVVETSKGTWRCGSVISAIGLSEPNQLGKNLRHPRIIGYEELTEDVSMFEGKRVAIVGSGNAGFETAAAISKVSAHCDMFATSEIRFAHQTHYPGAVRIPNAGFLDQYLLKSLDSFILLEQQHIDKLRVHEAFGALVLTYAGDKVVEDIVASGRERDCKAIDLCLVYDYIIRAVGWKFDRSTFKPSAMPNLEKPGEVTKRGGKYPSMTAAYESKNVPGLYFAGAAAHALDFGRSAGGFIHGFRYTSRALVRHLNVKNHGGSWPTEKLRSTSHAVTHCMQRMNTASSLYQMYGTLADIILFDETSSSATSPSGDAELTDAMRGARYLVDVPLKMIEERLFVVGPNAEKDSRNGFIATITLEFGETFHGRFVVDHANRDPMTGRRHGDGYKAPNLFLHPVLRLYRRAKRRDGVVAFADATPVYTAHLEEDLATDWTHPIAHRDVVRKFFRRASLLANGVRPDSPLGRKEYDGPVHESRYEKALPMSDIIRHLASSITRKLS